jgi:hypothetical protein
MKVITLSFLTLIIWKLGFCSIVFAFKNNIRDSIPDPTPPITGRFSLYGLIVLDEPNIGISKKRSMDHQNPKPRNLLWDTLSLAFPYYIKKLTLSALFHGKRGEHVDFNISHPKP